MPQGNKSLERALAAAEDYIPILEEMFDVDLSGLQIKDWSAEGADFYDFLQGEEEWRGWDEDIVASLQKEKKRSEQTLKEVYIGYRNWKNNIVLRQGPCYDYYMDTIYLPHLKINTSLLHISLVHEIGHAIHARIEPEEKFKKREGITLYVSEGFADYVSIDIFGSHYTRKGMDEVIERWANPPQSEVDLARSLSSGLFKWLFPYSPADRGPQYGPGRELFLRAAEEGIRPETIFKNPPEDENFFEDFDSYFSGLKESQ